MKRDSVCIAYGKNSIAAIGNNMQFPQKTEMQYNTGKLTIADEITRIPVSTVALLYYFCYGINLSIYQQMNGS